MKPSLRLIPICALTLLLPCAVLAQASSATHLPDWAPKPPPRIAEDKLRAEVVVFSAGMDTQLRIDDSLTALGTLVSGEDDLQLDDSKLLAQAEITLLPGQRHLVRLSGMAVHRSAQTTLERPVDFDDQTYLIGERVDSELNLTMFGLTYGYRFVVRERGEFTGTFGIQIAEVEANAVVRSRVIRDAENGVAPIPFAGLEGRIDLSRRWSLEARAQYLTVDVDEVDGSILDARAALTWRKNPHFVFGLGYRTFEIEVDSRSESTPGFVSMTIEGPLLFMRASL